jgi:putative flippase GtrA
MPLVSKLKELLQLKLKYAASAGIATAVDYGIFFGLKNGFLFSATLAQPFAYATGVLVNFMLQKRFVFALNRSVWSAFGLALLVSLGGLLLSTGIIYLLDNHLPFFRQHSLLAKLLTSGIVFFYNFYLKRLVFEGKFI